MRHNARTVPNFPTEHFRTQALPHPPAGWKGIEITGLAEDSCGKLWLGTTSGIYVIAKDGAALRISKRSEGLPGDYVNALVTAGGRIWGGMRGGLTLLRDGCPAGAPGVERVYPQDVALDAIALAQGSDGALWIGTSTGLVRLRPANGSAKESIEKWTRAQGLADRSIFALASGKSGNVWAGTEGGGVMNIQPGGFTTFNEQDGLRSDRVWSLLEDRAGRLVAVTGSEDQSVWRLNIFDGSKFRSQPAPKVFAEGNGRGAAIEFCCRAAAVTGGPRPLTACAGTPLGPRKAWQDARPNNVFFPPKRSSRFSKIRKAASGRRRRRGPARPPGIV